MLEMINFVFVFSASMESSSRCESDSDSADNGCLENVTDLWMSENQIQILVFLHQDCSSTNLNMQKKDGTKTTILSH